MNAVSLGATGQAPADGYPLVEDVRRRFHLDPRTGRIFHRTGAMQGKQAFTSDTNGYLRGRIGKQVFFAHQVAWVLAYGYWPKERGLTIDHLNGDRSDNRLANLRAVPQAENQRNKGISSRNTTGVTGVHVMPNGRFHARIRVAFRHISLGYYDTLHEAVIARTAAEKALGFIGSVRKPRPEAAGHATPSRQGLSRKRAG